MMRNRTLSLHNLCRQPFLWCARASTQRWRRRHSDRRGSRFVYAVRARRLRAVVLREVVLQVQLFVRNCSPRNRSPSSRYTIFSREVVLVEIVLWEVVLLEVALGETVLRTAVTLQERILTARVPHSEGATRTLSTRIENQDHADRVFDRGQKILINI